MNRTATIVFIHGMMGDGNYWHEWKVFFEKKGYRCYAPTLRMHDFSIQEDPDPELGKVGISDYVDDLAAFIATLKEKPILIGHSMGGLIAQLLGAKGLASKVVLLASAPPAGIFALNLPALRSFISIISTCCFWKKPVRLTFNDARYALMNLLTDEQAKLLYETGRWESGKVAAQIGFWFFDLRKSIRVDASKIVSPLLVIAGTKDHTISVSTARKIAHKYPTARYLEYPDHAHWIIGEKGWEEVCEMTACWLENTTQKD